MTGEVRRDRWGIPHVVAGTVEEVAFLQGRAAVADRAWQLELSRLKAEGRTASVLGQRGLAWDRFARRIGLEALARRARDGLSPETAGFVDSYVAGVNDGFGQVGSVPELDELGGRPGEWQAWTPLGVFAAVHVLFATFPSKLWRDHVRGTLGAEAARLFHHEGLWTAGSNSWVVGGERTASGLPLIGGDPHRTFEAPNVYAQVRLTCEAGEGGFDVAGFTFPGVPGVQHFGHAGHVAWGITNAMADYQDVFVERLERRGPEVLAQGPEGWRPAQVHRERIEVRGGAAETVEVVVTGNGPVFSGGPEEEVALSLRTAAYALGDLGFEALLPLLRARTAEDVEAAFGHWVEPVNNLLVADDQGAARQRVVGRVPERAEENRWGAVPGWSPRHQWVGWLAGLPATEVAPDGHLVTANHRMTPEFDRIGVEFAPPGRARRIDALLTGRRGLTPLEMAAVHRDDLAGQPAVLLEAITGLAGLSPVAEALQRNLAAWDQHLCAESRTAAAYVGVRDALVTGLARTAPFSVLADTSPVGSLFEPWFSVPTQLYLSLANLLSDQGRALIPDLDERLAAAVEEVAATEVEPWGSRHRFRPAHALGWNLPSGPAEGPELAGDNDCVRCTGALPGGDVAVRGSVARYVWDLSGLESSHWVVPMGAAGDPRSPHASDQMPAWVAGTLHQVSWDFARNLDERPIRR